MRSKFILIIVCFFIADCSKNKQIQQSLLQDEYDVYSCVLNRFCVINERINKLDTLSIIPIYETTIIGCLFGEKDSYLFRSKSWIDDSSLSLRKSSISDNWDLMIANYKLVWSDSLRIDLNKVKVSRKCVLFNSSERKLRWDPWKISGFIYFSRVGFNANKTEGIVYYKRSGEEGEQMTILLRKENNIWQIVDAVSLFDSGYKLFPLFSVEPATHPKKLMRK